MIKKIIIGSTLSLITIAFGGYYFYKNDNIDYYMKKTYSKYNIMIKEKK